MSDLKRSAKQTMKSCAILLILIGLISLYLSDLSYPGLGGGAARALEQQSLRAIDIMKSEGRSNKDIEDYIRYSSSQQTAYSMTLLREKRIHGFVLLASGILNIGAGITMLIKNEKSNPRG